MAKNAQLSRIFFQDFQGPNRFSRTLQKLQVLEFSRKNPGLSKRHGNPGIIINSYSYYYYKIRYY